MGRLRLVLLSILFLIQTVSKSVANHQKVHLIHVLGSHLLVYLKKWLIIKQLNQLIIINIKRCDQLLQLFTRKKGNHIWEGIVG